MNVCLYATTNNAGPLFASAKKSLEFVSNVCSCACIVILAVYTCLSAEFKCEMIEVRLIAICLPSPRSLVRLHSSWTLLTLTDNNSRNCYTPIYRATIRIWGRLYWNYTQLKSKIMKSTAHNAMVVISTGSVAIFYILKMLCLCNFPSFFGNYCVEYSISQPSDWIFPLDLLRINVFFLFPVDSMIRLFSSFTLFH